MNTSKSAYYGHLISGSLGKQAESVFLLIRKIGNMTGTEVDEALGARGAHVRLPELVKKGILERGVIRPCSVTGRPVQSYQMASGSPPTLQAQEKPRRSPSRPMSLDEFYAQEREEMMRLRDE